MSTSGWIAVLVVVVVVARILAEFIIEACYPDNYEGDPSATVKYHKCPKCGHKFHDTL